MSLMPTINGKAVWAPTIKTILQTLITKLKSSRDYKHHYKLFKEFIDKKDRPATNTIHYFLFYDLDDLKFKIEPQITIPHNSLVLATGFVPSKHELKQMKRIEDYQWSSVKK